MRAVGIRVYVGSNTAGCGLRGGEGSVFISLSAIIENTSSSSGILADFQRRLAAFVQEDCGWSCLVMENF